MTDRTSLSLRSHPDSFFFKGRKDLGGIIALKTAKRLAVFLACPSEHERGAKRSMDSDGPIASAR